MALSTEEIKNRYPIPAYNFRVSIFPAGNNLTTIIEDLPVEFEPALISCSEITGLSMDINTVSYRHGYSFLTGSHIIPTQTKEVRLSIRKGVTKNGRYLSDWMQLCYPILLPKPLSFNLKRDILIDLCNDVGDPLIRWLVKRAMPIKLSAPSFIADTSEVAIEQLDLIAQELKVEYLT